MIYTATTAPVASLIRAAGLVGRSAGSRKRFKEREIINLVSAFDIETTTIHLPPTDQVKRNDHSFMYVWQWQFGPDCTVIGRTWDEFLTLADEIRQTCEEVGEEKKTDEPPVLVSWVHNLAYEFQFLCGVYPFRADECFFRKARKPVYCRMLDTLEFRCSYIQTNMSLARFAKQMGCATQKQSGQQFDYSKVRYPWTDLTPAEIEYCIDDVISLVQAMTAEMERDGDTLRSIPLTSTGYVRRDCKEASAPARWLFKQQLPGIEEYKMMRLAFRGGNTHANRYLVNQIWDNVESYDMTSCYPAQQLTKMYPCKPFRFLSTPISLERVSNFVNAGYAVVGDYEFIGLRLKNEREPVPYLSLSKTRSADFLIDNGRILAAEYCNTVLTEIDLKIVLKQYKFKKMAVRKAMVAQKSPLPDCYKQCIMDYYRKKTTLKGMDIDSLKTALASDPDPDPALKRLETTDDIDYIYQKSKNKLNAVYGMSCQDPVHMNVELHLDKTDGLGGEYVVSDYDSGTAEHDLLRAHWPYQLGVYTTAYARAALQEGIDAAGEFLIYCDTDSIKTIKKIDFSRINAQRQALAEKWGAVALDKKGNPHYMGVFEKDAQYDQFITQGSKRYAYTHDGEIGVTVSGVTKEINEKTGRTYAAEELGSLENFRKGFCFRKAGGTGAIYNDLDDFDYHAPDGSGTVHIGRNVTIIDTTYELGYSEDYEAILFDTELYTRWVHDHE